MALPRSASWNFIDLAATGSNTARAYLTVTLQVILFPIAFVVLVYAVAAFVPLPQEVAQAVPVVSQFGSIVVAGFALLRAVPRYHLRPRRSLIAPDLRIDSRRLAIGVAAQLVITLALLLLIHAVTGWPWRFALPDALPLVVFTLVMIPLQAATEELLFRGYLTQALGRLMRRRIGIALIVGLVFGALHLNTYGPLTVPYFLTLSLIYSLVSLRDGRLELVIAGHAATNFFAVATAGFLPLAPAAIGIGGGAMQFNTAALALLVVQGAVFYGLTRLMVRLFCRPRPLKA